jgi:dihydroflavonol-4-reductase
MKVVVVGGAGMIGAHIALRFRDQGHDVTIAGRTAPAVETALGALRFQRINYIEDEDPKTRLRGFDLMVFAAGNDIRHVPEGADYHEHVTMRTPLPSRGFSLRPKMPACRSPSISAATIRTLRSI